MRFFRRKRSHEFESRISPGKYLLAPFRGILSVLGGKDEELGQDVSSAKKFRRKLAFAFIFPLWILYQFVIFVVTSWTSTRDGHAAMWGVIPLLGIGAVVGILTASGFLEDRLTKRFHREAIIAAEEAEDFDTAILYSRRVQNINHEDTWRFIHAMTLVRSGKQENADVIMNELADPQVAGHVPAHLYLATELLKVDENSPEYKTRLATAREHLERVHDKEPKLLSANILRAKVMYEQGDLDGATTLYKSFVSEAPEVVPDLARYYIENGKDEMADLQIEKGLAAIKEALADNPAQPELWNVMYSILMVRSDYNGALKELENAKREFRDPQVRAQIHNLQANVYIRFADTITDVEFQDGYRRKLIPVCRAIEAFPRNAEALSRLIDLVLYPANEQVIAWLDVEARDNVAPEIYHIIYGIRHAVAGEPVTSKSHFTLAFDGDVKTSIVVNDLALILTMKKMRHRDALKLVDVAIDTWPETATLFHTRGKILMQLDRHPDAVGELEYAASQINRDPVVFTSLAECYDTLGRTEDARIARASARSAQEELDAMRAEIEARRSQRK